MPSIVSSFTNVSGEPGLPRVPCRRPVKRTVAAYGSAPSPESNQWVATMACGSLAVSVGVLSPGAGRGAATGESGLDGCGVAAGCLDRGLPPFVADRRRAPPRLPAVSMPPGEAGGPEAGDRREAGRRGG